VCPFATPFNSLTSPPPRRVSYIHQVPGRRPSPGTAHFCSVHPPRLYVRCLATPTEPSLAAGSCISDACKGQVTERDIMREDRAFPPRHRPPPARWMRWPLICFGPASLVGWEDGWHARAMPKSVHGSRPNRRLSREHRGSFSPASGPRPNPRMSAARASLW